MSSENIFVCCRVRPIIGLQERDAGRCVNITPDGTTITIRNNTVNEERSFGFDKVFSPYSNQEDVYHDVVQPMIDSVLNGYSSAIIAYGQTSSGKTHTMLGTADNPGIIPRTADALFQQISKADSSVQFCVDCRAVQIYKEKLLDMLSEGSEPQFCDILEDHKQGLYVTSATEIPVFSPDEVRRVLSKAETMRVVAATAQNLESSRSHAVFIITVTKKDLLSGSEKIALLYLVDLAGSEGLDKTLTSGLQLDEARYINTSLLTLRRVIDSLVNKDNHVPYRDSKLTRLLKNSFGGSSRTALIVCVSPSTYNETETVASLRFGSNTRQIQNKPIQTVLLNAEELERLISEAQLKLLQAKAHLFLLQNEYEKVVQTSAE